MSELTDLEISKLEGGSNCAASIVFSASFGGLFGGAGAVIFGLAAATGPNCLQLWGD